MSIDSVNTAVRENSFNDYYNSSTVDAILKFLTSTHFNPHLFLTWFNEAPVSIQKQVSLRISPEQQIQLLTCLVEGDQPPANKSEQITDFLGALEPEKLSELFNSYHERKSFKESIRLLAALKDASMIKQFYSLLQSSERLDGITKQTIFMIELSKYIREQNADKIAAFDYMMEQTIPDPKRRLKDYDAHLKTIRNRYPPHLKACILWAGSKELREDLLKISTIKEKAELILHTTQKEKMLEKKIALAEKLMHLINSKDIPSLFEKLYELQPENTPFLFVSLPLKHFDRHITKKPKIADIWKKIMVEPLKSQESVDLLTKKLRKWNRAKKILDIFSTDSEPKNALLTTLQLEASSIG